MEKKIDKRRNYVIVIDTETAPMDREFEGVDPTNMAVYDCGWVVCDKQGRVYESHSFINADIFLDEKEMMNSAYYAEKIPMYWERIKSGESQLKSFANIRKAFCEDVATYNVEMVFAHNMRFDLGALNNTERWETKSKYRYFFPYGVRVCDTMKMARDVILPRPTYKSFCEKNGYMTKHKTPRPQLTAEVLYRYMTQDTEFIEEHTGLADVMIEKEIMAYCYRTHKKMRVGLYE